MRRRRVSRWDRPAGPKDVRWFLRLVGKVLICIGVLMFGFVGYQLWGTGIEYARAQDRAEDQFNEMLDRVSTTTAPPATTGPSPTAAGVTSPGLTSPTTPAPGATTLPGTAPPSTAAEASTTSPPTSTTTVPVPGAVADFSDTIAAMEITEGEPIGFLHFPTLEHGMYIYPGVSREDLKNGPGHFPETPMPGQLGNSAIAGHRTTYGEPFIDVDKLQVGDEIIVTMPYGMFTYVVTSSIIVEPSDREVIATTDPDTAMLTLATCHPKYSAQQRLIIHAELVLEKSGPPGLPVINYGRDTPIPAGGDLPGDEVGDPTTTPVPTTAAASVAAPTSAVPGESDETITPAPTTAPGAPPTTADPIYSVEPGGGATGGPGDLFDSDDEAFSNRWFSDEEAFPQVTLWAGTCAAIAVAAYQLAKRFRNLFVGLVVGIAPFVIGLYFFYENVNRLLPAAL